MSDSSTDGAIGLVFAVGLLIVIGWIFTFLLIPVVLAGIGLLIYLIAKLIWNSETLVEKRISRQTWELYESVRGKVSNHTAQSPAEFRAKLEEDFPPENSELFPALLDCGEAIYRAEPFPSDEIPEPPYLCNTMEGARYRDRLNTISRRTSETDTATTLHMALFRCFSYLALNMPSHPPENERDQTVRFSVPLMEVVSEPGEIVFNVIAPFYSEEVRNASLFNELRAKLDENLSEMSAGKNETIYPDSYDGSAEEIVHGYLKGTPLERIFDSNVPIFLPRATRFEHHWIVAGTGHGKTQTLQYLVSHDLDSVKAGNASVVVIDSQGDLIRNISRLKRFAPGGDLEGRLCLIDPTDIEYPVALNLFDINMERINRYSQLDRERLINGVLELYDFVLGSLLSAELTQKQSVMFRYITRLMLHIPDANIQTLRELMDAGGYEKYRSYIDQLEGTARAFFETEFNSKEFEQTKRQVVRRLWGILENQTFERMFSHPRNKLDLFSELNSGKVILINTAKELLKQNGTEIFGRFFIAMIAQAAQERAVLSESSRLPTYVYIDECQDYLDHNTALILEQARKYRVGMILAHQYAGQLSQRLQDSFAANTSIKFAGGVSSQDARLFSRHLRCQPSFVEDQPRGHFAAFIRGTTERAASLRIPFGVIEKLPRMESEEQEAVRANMRQQYAVHYSEVQQSIAGQLSPVETNEARIDPDEITSESGTNW